MTAVVPWSSAGDEDAVDAEVVELVKKGVTVEAATNSTEYYEDEDDYELEEVIEQPVTKARELALSVARPIPSARQVVARAWWWTRVLARITPWLPVMLLRELRPIFRGLGRVAVGWAAWVQCVELAEAIKAAEGNERSKATERYTKRKTARTWGSLVFLVVVAGGAMWLYLAVTGAFWLAVALLVVVFDCVGRRGREVPDNPIPVATQPPWTNPAVSLAQLTRTVIETFEREGFEQGTVQVAKPMWVEDGRMERRIRIKTSDKIEYRHIEAVEIALGAPNGAIRNLATDSSAVRELVMSYGDPLAHVPPPEDHEPLSRTITQPLPLGQSSGDRPFAVKFAGLHTAVIGKTGSGKSKSMLNAIINELSACKDVVLYGIDLQGGPLFTSWSGVVQAYAEEPEEALALLEKVQREIDRRMKVLQAIVEDDDPDNDTDEWHAGLGPALVIPIDEFAVFAENDGSKKHPVDLMTPLERIIRTGRKTWVTLVLATQKAGNSDFGSTVISSQCANKILMACENEDVNSVLGKALKEQGWQPHLFAPAEDDHPQDAGKAYVYTPTHRTPDIYRAFAPLRPSEIRRRGKSRVEAGLPTLDGRRHESVDAVEVPPLLAAVEAAFVEAGSPDRMPTAELVTRLRGGGHNVDEYKLAAGLRPAGLRPATSRWTPPEGGNPVRGYLLADVRVAIRGLG